jgi:hypothetical protein
MTVDNMSSAASPNHGPTGARAQADRRLPPSPSVRPSIEQLTELHLVEMGFRHVLEHRGSVVAQSLVDFLS